jgi:hypothetical protein
MKVAFGIHLINELPTSYPSELIDFFKNNDLKIPKLKSMQGIALSLMSTYKHYYFNRKICNDLFQKFNIESNDSIQPFNKIEQLGIRTSKERGKYYLVLPYQTSNKYKMRKNFKYGGSLEELDIEINKIKSTIVNDYIDVPNEDWQLGHVNPGLEDNSINNLVLQPPIQSKYRDEYIFIDPLTKIPTPKKLKQLIKKKELVLSKEQIYEYFTSFNYWLKEQEEQKDPLQDEKDSEDIAYIQHILS